MSANSGHIPLSRGLNAVSIATALSTRSSFHAGEVWSSSHRQRGPLCLARGERQSLRWLDERTARERDLSPGQFVSLCVSDTGGGMLPEVIAKAFDPFFTTRPIGMRSGLGLSMIYGFAK